MEGFRGSGLRVRVQWFRVKGLGVSDLELATSDAKIEEDTETTI